MTYDHATKSGNEGDVVKHVALLAALDVLFAARAGNGTTFVYADTFAGYASTRLLPGGAWASGAGRLAGRATALDANPHTALWRRWYLAAPVLAGTTYPGSSKVAADVAAHRAVPISLALWDVSARVVADLRATWGPAATVVGHPAGPGDILLEQADFVFVDPPDLEAWPDILRYLERPRAGGSLVWLPILRDEVLDASPAGHVALDVRWPGAGRTVGCRLLHRLPSEAATALEAAARHVADVAGWHAEPSTSSSRPQRELPAGTPKPDSALLRPDTGPEGG